MGWDAYTVTTYRTWHLLTVGLLAMLFVGCGASPYASPPTKRAIHRELSSVVEPEDPEVHFARQGPPLTISDGKGGTLTAVLGMRHVSADGHGQLVFFWHGRHFLGHDTRVESTGPDSLSSPSAGVFTVHYARFSAKDAMCCPSLAPVKVDYRWNGKSLVPDRRLPVGTLDMGMPVYQETTGQPTITPLPTPTPLPTDTPSPADVLASSCALEGTRYSAYSTETVHLLFAGSDASTLCTALRDKWNRNTELAPLKTLPEGWTGTTDDRQACSYTVYSVEVSVFTDARYGATQAAVACNWIERISTTQ